MGITKTKKGIILDNILGIDILKDNLIKVTRSTGTGLYEDKSLIVDEPEDLRADFKYEGSGNGITISTSRVKCFVDANGCIIFSDLLRNVIVKERPSEFTQSFSITSDEGLYGLGFHQNGAMNYRNITLQMLQVNGKHTAVPFMVSTKGYGILWDNYSYTSIGIDKPAVMDSFDDIQPDEEIPNTINIYSEWHDQISYYITFNTSIDKLISDYRTLTGKTPMFPKWAYGYFQSREHYQTQEQILSIAKEFRDREIPIDVIVQDWNYWTELGFDKPNWNSLRWAPGKYPDPEYMIDYIHNKLNMKIMLSVWSSFGPETEIVKELENIGAILERPDKSGENWGRVHDPYSSKAADMIWSRMNKEFFSKGIDAWWLDSTEPALDKDSALCLQECSDCAIGPNKKYLNTYAYMVSKNVYMNQRKTSDKKRAFILTRSGFAGQQKNGTLTWTGDIGATWDVFKIQLSSLLNFSISGVPYSTTDIGAFFVNYEGGYNNEEYRELYTRWFWFGAFSPIFRSHGTSTPREMWFFGDKGTKYYDGQMAAMNLRYKLMPYIYSTAFSVTNDDYTIMRPLVMDFTNDRNVYNMYDQYMFGKSLMVGIVTDYKTEEKSIYLPSSANWYDFYTGEVYGGGQCITVKTPMDRTPLFVRAGSIIPMGPYVQYSDECPDAPIDIHIYTGADAEFALYEDENNNYNYEKGCYTRIYFNWDDDNRALTISDRTGCFEGMLQDRVFNLFVNGYNANRQIDYSGSKIAVTL